MGMGVLGMMAVKLLKVAGAAPIIAVDPVESKRKQALQLGADYALDPFAPDFEALIQTMKQTGKVFHTGYMYRYNPYIRDLLERIRRGDLGKIISVEAQMNCIHLRQLRQWLGNFPGGMMFYLGCHLVDLILQIQGQPKEIIPLNTTTGCNTQADDFGMAVFVYENGVSFAKTTALEIGGYARRQLVVTGTEGTVEIRLFYAFFPFKSNNAIRKLAITTRAEPIIVRRPRGSAKTRMPMITLVMGSKVLRIEVRSLPMKNALC